VTNVNQRNWIMTRYVMKSNWDPYIGSDYVEALESDNLKDAEEEAEQKIAWDSWEGSDDDDYEDEGPDWIVEEYDPERHDMYKSGGGSFEDQFKRFEERRVSN
jgi:hypothetical protein